MSLLRGRRYNRAKRAIPNPVGRNQHTEVDGQNVRQPLTAQKLAEAHGVNEKTIRRDGAFAAAVERLRGHTDSGSSSSRGGGRRVARTG